MFVVTVSSASQLRCEITPTSPHDFDFEASLPAGDLKNAASSLYPIGF